jgi:hypothetical protein
MTAPTNNPFLDLADKQIVSAKKARYRAAEKRAANAPSADEKRRIENEHLLRLYRNAHEEARLALLAGPYCEMLLVLIGFLNAMTLESGDDLVALVEAQAWRDADLDTRQEIVHIINEAIGQLRVKHGLREIDDPLPHEPASAFVLIREMLR